MRLSLVDNLIMPAVQDLNLLDLHPHLGLLSLAAVAEADGHEVRIFDPKRRLRDGSIAYDHNLYRRAAAAILAQEPEAVGFTTLGCSFLFAVRTAEVLRQAEPDLPILLGGPHATMLASEILREFACFDVIVRHEAEETLPLVLRNLRTRMFEMIPGITWRTPKGVRSTSGSPRIEDLDSLPIVSYEHYPVEELNLDLMRVEAGRGCPYECTFCSTAQFFQRRYRLKSPARLVREMDRLSARYGVKEFKLDHDLFTVDRRKVLAFCEAVKDCGYRWRVSARVDRVDDELLTSMANAGCVGIYFGIETGSQRLQRIIQKNLDLSLVEPILRRTASLGIEATASVITGFPVETQEDLDASLDFLGQTFSRPTGTCLPQLHLLTPEPGTLLFSEFGDQLLFDGHPTPFNARIVSQEDRELVQNYPKIFASYHYYPTCLPRPRHTVAVDFVDLLRRLDRATFIGMLARFSGRLSAATQSLWDLAEQEGEREVDANLMIRHVTTALGLRWSNTGLYDPGLAYRLSPWARIEYGSVRREGPAATLPADSSRAGIGRGAEASLIITTETETIIRRMNAGLAHILELFRTPRRIATIITELENLTGVAIPDDTAFRELVAKDILIPAELEADAQTQSGAGKEAELYVGLA